LGVQGLAIIALFLIPVAFLAALYVALCGVVGWQARQRGYSFWLWTVTSIFGNPLFIIVLLTLLPDARKQALRQQEMAELEAKLADQARRVATPDAAPVPATSVGDQITVVPPARSVGDEETRL
jgi:hypothetical protein